MQKSGNLASKIHFFLEFTKKLKAGNRNISAFKKNASVFWLKHQSVLFLFFHLLEIIFSYPTKRANPIVGNIFKRSARQNATIRVTFIWVVHPVTDCTNILFHKLFIKWLPYVTSETDYCSSESRRISSSIPSEAPFWMTWTFLLEAIGTCLGSMR